MNPEAKEELERILELNPEELTGYDIEFLNARRDYLNKEQRRVFASVLIDEAAPDILDENGRYTGNRGEVQTEEPANQPAAPAAPTRKELSDKAIAMGIDGALVKKAKTNADIQVLIDNAQPAQTEQAQPEQSAQVGNDQFAGGNADPDAKV